MKATHTNFVGAMAGLAMVAVAAAGCSRYTVDQGRSPSQVVIMNLEAASGAQSAVFGGTLDSDVITVVNRTVGGRGCPVRC